MNSKVVGESTKIQGDVVEEDEYMIFFLDFSYCLFSIFIIYYYFGTLFYHLILINLSVGLISNAYPKAKNLNQPNLVLFIWFRFLDTPKLFNRFRFLDAPKLTQLDPITPLLSINLYKQFFYTKRYLLNPKYKKSSNIYF